MVFAMKPIKHIAVVVALILLAGCATTFRPWKLSEVQEGMDREQVVDLLGDPDSVETKDGAEYLYYSYSEDYNPPLSSDNPVEYENDRVLREYNLRRSLKEYKYAVKLVDGKVQNYKELTD